MAQAVRHRLLTAEIRVRFQGSPKGICGGRSDIWTGVSPGKFGFPISIIPRNLHIHKYHLPTTIYELSNSSVVKNTLQQQTMHVQRTHLGDFAYPLLKVEKI
jgi:hypothetical protein